MQQILIATRNRGKMEEIQALFAGLDYALLTPADLGLQLDVAEVGDTYAENATIKGSAFAEASGLLCLADDSGLEVEALGGQPGIRSARFSPLPGATDRDRRRYLLEKLQGLPRPWRARFCCAVALVNPGQPVRLAHGECPGEIIPQERGDNGFGYDPIFLVDGLGRTMAELGMQEKNLLSHRGRAIQAALPILDEMLSK